MNGYLDLARASRVIRTRWKLVLGATSLIAAAAGVAIAFVKPTWEATGVVQVGAAGLAGGATQPAESPARAIERLRMRTFQNATLSSLGIPETDIDPSGTLYRHTLNVTQLAGTDFLQIRVRAFSPEESSSWLRATVEHLATVHDGLTAPAVARLRRQSEEMQASLKRIEQIREKLLAASAAKGALQPGERFAESVYHANLLTKTDDDMRAVQTQLDLLYEQLSPSRTYPTALIDKVYVSELPVSPKCGITISIAAMFGFFTGIMLAFFLEGRKALRALP